MAKLLVIDREEYVLEGEFERIRVPNNVMIDEENVLSAIEKYKNDYVDQGMALGVLNKGFLVMPTEYGEQVVGEEKEPAFMIIDVYWNSEEKAICGKLILLDTDSGDEAKNAINQGIECFMSTTNTETYTTMDNETGRMLCRISNISGYELSIFNFHSII